MDIDKLLPYLDKVVETVENASPIVWEAFYRQQIIEGWTTIATIPIFAAVLLYGMYILKRRPNWAIDRMDDNVGGFVIISIGILMTSIAVFFTIFEGIPKIINPTFYAVKALIGG